MGCSDAYVRIRANDIFAIMVSSRALSIVACVIAAVTTGPLLPNVPGATQQFAETSAAAIAITDVTVIDVITGAHRTGLTVLIRNDRIAAIAPTISIPREATRVDGKRKFLIPGLWDMHSHHQGTGADSLDLFVAKGIVGTRDMGGDADFILPLRERVKSGETLGPEIVTSGPILDDAPPDFPYRRRGRNAAEAREAVRDLKRLGVDFIKVHDHTPREVFFAIADEAPKLGLTFAGHVPMNITVEEADAGMRSIEHLANYRDLATAPPVIPTVLKNAHHCLTNWRLRAFGKRRQWSFSKRFLAFSPALHCLTLNMPAIPCWHSRVIMSEFRT
jgi:hypothetical protein